MLLPLLLLTACSERQDDQLIGTWRAVDIRENGDSLKLDPTEINFEFTPDNRYRYRSTLNYTEAGTWKYENGYLYARDTTGHGAGDYIVAVDLLRPDSLLLRMKADSAERKVLLLRQHL